MIDSRSARVLALAAIAAASALVGGCVPRETLLEDISGLMPAPVATKIVRDMWPDYNGGSYLVVDNERFPIATKYQIFAFEKSNTLSIQIRRAGGMTYSAERWICAVTLDDARNFAQALKSLGGEIEMYAIGGSKGGSRCNWRKR